MIYIVMKNDFVDQVFDNPDAAENHAKNLRQKWNRTEIIVRELRSF